MARIALVAAVPLLACRSTPRFDVGPAPDGVSVDAQVQYYDVTAGSLSELQRKLREQGPRFEGRAYDAVTQSQIRWTYQYDQRSSVCALRQVHVRVRTLVTFPRWTPGAEADTQMVDWWRQLSAGLVQHERGHAAISLGTAGEIARSLQDLSAASCEILGTQANALGQRLLDADRGKQSMYDRETRHGATQIQQAARLLNP